MSSLSAGRPRGGSRPSLATRVLDRLNCEFILSDDRTPNSEEGLNFFTGERKLQLLARSKVLLNVHGEGEPYFEWLRAAEAISSGCRGGH